MSRFLILLTIFLGASERLVDATRDQNAGVFLAQRISIAIQRGNAASMLSTLPSGSGLQYLDYLSTITAKQYRFDYKWSEEAKGWMKYHVIPATWDEARLRCHAEGAVLASPLTNKLKAAVLNFVREKEQTNHGQEYNGDPVKIFTGVHATFSKGDYASVEGVPLLRLSIIWAPGEPDNFENSESCLVMMTNQNGTMADAKCGDVLRYVCYKKDTHLVDTRCGTSDLGYSLDYQTGSCYKFHRSGLVWSQAYMTCMAEGGYLAIINNAAEAEIVKKIFSEHAESTIFSNYKSSLMIGFHDWGDRGRSFMTIHGESLENLYNTWSPGQPSSAWRNDEGSQLQLVFGGNIFRNGLLDDINTSVPLAFLCEKDPNSLR